jgi:restriction endonuclease S subunit
VPQGWALARLEEVLDYEQPTAYIVESTNYSDDYVTPVLTAGKSFVIGYTNETNGVCVKLPVIIFDDFTTDSRYVNFQFKVKSSAMKILHSIGADMKYLFYCMQTIECNHTTHKRYWISDFSKKIILLPPLAEQLRIVEIIDKSFEFLDDIVANLI